MSIIDCPECGSRISDQATICPKCGIVLKPDLRRSKSLITVGSIINVFGGIGFTIMIASMLITSNGNESDYTVSITTGHSYAALTWIAYIALVIITILSLILLTKHEPSRKLIASTTTIQFVLAIFATAFQVLACNLMIFYVGWFLIWGNTLQAIGSILCFAGMLSLNR